MRVLRALEIRVRGKIFNPLLSLRDTLSLGEGTKEPRHAELDSASHSVILSEAKNLKSTPLPSFGHPLPWRGKEQVPSPLEGEGRILNELASC